MYLLEYPLPRFLAIVIILQMLCCAKLLQSCPTLCDPIDGSPPGSPIPGIPGKNTGVGCHFLLQCMKVKSESEVAQSHLTRSDPMDCSPPGSSIQGTLQARVLEWLAIAFSPILQWIKEIEGGREKMCRLPCYCHQYSGLTEFCRTKV